MAANQAERSNVTKEHAGALVAVSNLFRHRARQVEIRRTALVAHDDVSDLVFAEEGPPNTSGRRT